jgi:hypothetical protein
LLWHLWLGIVIYQSSKSAQLMLIASGYFPSYRLSIIVLAKQSSMYFRIASIYDIYVL